jgi:hypothetical protein
VSTVFLAVEDDLSEAVAEKLLGRVFGAACVPQRLGKGRARGSGQIRINLWKYADLARTQPVAVITDLDDHKCPIALINDWFGLRKIPAGMAFRIAVRETEAWLMADRAGLSMFLGVPERLIPDNVEAISRPKERLIGIAGRARRELRNEIVPARGSLARQGLGYNDVLSRFVRESWNADAAKSGSESLRRAISGFERLRNALRPGMAATPIASRKGRKT